MSSQVETVQFSGTGDLYDYIESRNEPEWASEYRRRALAIFAEGEWPSTTDEEWRRSDISSYDFDSYAYRGESDPWDPAGGGHTEGATQEDAESDGLFAMDMETVTDVFLSDHARAQGVILAPIGDFLRDASDDVSLRASMAMAKDLGNIDNKIQAWHYAVYNGGAALYLPPGTALEKPIRIEIRTTGEKRLSAPHILVIAGRESSAKIVQVVRGDDDGEILYNEGVTLSLEDGAHISYASYHDLNIDSVVFTNCFAYVGRDAAIAHFTGAFGGMFAKHRADVHMLGPGADAQIRGLYFGREDQHMDLRTVQYHREGNSGSRTFYKGVVRDEARSVYQGLIEVAHGADKTDAYLTNNNLILNDGARADSIPSLRIHTDDVKCSHGSTTGKIDANQLYYLTTRGYSVDEARQLIVEGFFEEIAAQVDGRLAEIIRDTVQRRLAQ